MTIFEILKSGSIFEILLSIFACDHEFKGFIITLNNMGSKVTHSLISWGGPLRPHAVAPTESDPPWGIGLITEICCCCCLLLLNVLLFLFLYSLL